MIKLPIAEYRQPDIVDFEGHPLINALPPINSPKETAKSLLRIPTVGDEERSLPGHIRRHAMMRILDQFLFPTKSHVQLEQTLSAMIRRGYLGRNIAQSDYQRNLENSGRTDFKAVARNAGNAALVSSVIGCSGTGKSTAVEAILETYPQAIYHPEFQHTQLVWLKVECPHDGSVKNLCHNYFRAVDDALGTDYQQLYVKARSSAESMLNDIARVSALHSVGLLVIDEIQHLERSKSGGAAKMLNFFVTLTNVIKVPVLFIGTPKALDLFQPTMRSARRAAQFGSIDWGRFSHVDGGRANSEWDQFIARLWQLQWFKEPTPLTQDMKGRFWDYTQGIAHIAVALFYLSQARAVTLKREVIDQRLVDKVYNEELAMIHPMIDALRSGRDERILQYADLDLPSHSIRVSAQETAPVQIEQEVTESEPIQGGEPSKLEKLTGMLTQLGIQGDIAPILAQEALEQKPESSMFELVAHINQMEDRGTKTKPDEGRQKQKSRPLKPTHTEGDLRLMLGNTADETYETLQRNGIIVDITAYL